MASCNNTLREAEVNRLRSLLAVNCSTSVFPRKSGLIPQEPEFPEVDCDEVMENLFIGNSWVSCYLTKTGAHWANYNKFTTKKSLWCMEMSPCFCNLHGPVWTSVSWSKYLTVWFVKCWDNRGIRSKPPKNEVEAVSWKNAQTAWPYICGCLISSDLFFYLLIDPESYLTFLFSFYLYSAQSKFI